MEYNKAIDIIQELLLKKKDFSICYSAKDVEAVREWNNAIDECIRVVRNYV